MRFLTENMYSFKYPNHWQTFTAAGTSGFFSDPGRYPRREQRLGPQIKPNRMAKLTTKLPTREELAEFKQKKRVSGITVPAVLQLNCGVMSSIESMPLSW